MTAAELAARAKEIAQDVDSVARNPFHADPLNAIGSLTVAIELLADAITALSGEAMSPSRRSDRSKP